MERKTKVTAEDGQQTIHISREFDLPVELLFKAHEDPELFAEWMSHKYGTTQVLKYETKQHGGWAFQTVDGQGNVLFKANGAFHAFVPNEKIIRTFEMTDTPFDAQLEYLIFERLTDDTSRLTMQSIFRTSAQRDQLLSRPFAQGLDMAHNRLQQVVSKLK